MPSVNNTLKIKPLSPPSSLPDIKVTVKVGYTVIITKEMVQSASIYYQDQNVPLGDIKILYYALGGSWSNLLSQSNNSLTRAYFTNNGSRIYKTSVNSLVTNGDVSAHTISQDSFRVTGVSMGEASVYYTANAFDGTNYSSFTQNLYGRIIIKVISAQNIRPRSLQNGVQDVIINSFTNILGTTVTNSYADPEGDAPYKVKITSLPTKGTLLYMGQPVTVGQEILYQSVLAGMLVYKNDGTISTIGENDIFGHTISDTGSEEYF